MSWVPLLLAAWIIVDVVLVAAFIVLGRRRSEQVRIPVLRTTTPQVSAQPASRAAL